jgi:peptidoglycan hydrolase-like protein with peptidoglycan-binding domain
VLKVGSTGPTVTWQQRTLRTLGIYKGPINGKFDSATAQAVRRYEVLKGVMPTGESSPDLRAAIMQDVRNAKQYV